jgi:quercetin dioxygenase-like cupin family protein
MRLAPIISLLALFAGVSNAQNRPADNVHAVPVFQEPRHRPVFENPWVRVLDVRLPAGDTSGYHVHANRHVGVVIAGAHTWEQRPGQPPSAVDSLADSVGTIFDNATDSLPLTHRVGNADVVPFRYVVAQVLQAWGRTTSELSAGTGLEFEREINGVRVYRATLAPGQATARHRHEAPGLTVRVA